MKRYVRRAAAFTGIFLVLFGMAAYALSFHPDHRLYQMIGGFYREREDSLQAVYIGSSNCYAFWCPTYAWESEGIAVFPFASGNMPFYATEGLIRQARKTQPNAMFIVSVNGVEEDDLGASALHNLFDYMPWSQDKVDMIKQLTALGGEDAPSPMEFYFPWIRLRTQIGSIALAGVFPKDEGMKGSCYTSSYMSVAGDITDYYTHMDATCELPQMLIDNINHLLDYCEAEGVRILFVTVPRCEYTDTAQARINSVNDLIESRGFPTLVMTDLADEIGLDLTQDYYNPKHTNVHGSIKFTTYLSRYLKDNFGLDDRRGDPDYADWDEAFRTFKRVIAKDVLDYEWDADRRDYSIEAPQGVSEAVTGDGGMRFGWTKQDDAVCIYRKKGEGVWEEIARVEGDNTYIDPEGSPGCSYRLVSVRGNMYGHSCTLDAIGGEGA